MGWKDPRGLNDGGWVEMVLVILIMDGELRFILSRDGLSRFNHGY